MKRSRLQELSDKIREAMEELLRLGKDHQKILSRLDKVEAEIAALELARKEIFLEISSSEAVILCKEHQLSSYKAHVMSLVNEPTPDVIRRMPVND